MHRGFDIGDLAFEASYHTFQYWIDYDSAQDIQIVMLIL